MKWRGAFLLVAALGMAGLRAQTVVIGGGGGATLETNGTKNSSQALLNLAQGSNVTLSESGGTVTITASSTASTAFSALTGSTNTSAAMLVGTGASLAATGSGTIAATSAAACATTDGCWPKNGAMGTPSSIVLTNATSLPAAALPALTGDVTSSAGSAATSVVKVNGASVPTSALALGSNGSGQLTAFAPAWVCNAGLGDGLNAVPAGTYLQTTCYNGTGQTVTITGIKCFTDNSGSSTMNVSNGAGTGLLTGAVTCTSSFAAGTQSATTTVANGDYFKFTFVADGTSKQTTWVIIGTY